MKVFLIGHQGWIGSQYISLFESGQIDWSCSSHRAETPEFKKDLLAYAPSHVLCCIGRTHGTTKDGKKYTTIDYLENKETLTENINDNLFVPISLALFCKQHAIHFTYIGTGCIFEYDALHELGFTEDDVPNFFGSNYSIVKGFTDMLMHQTDALNLRIRMPITATDNSRNFITKILNYEKICSIPNSMSVLDELLPLSIEMMNNQETGTFNFTNPGVISHNEILQMYKDIIDPAFEWINFTPEEQANILLASRSNNLLNTCKLSEKYKISGIHDAVRKCITNWTRLD
jgi:nucleoside-diphosphate-sugar epimerase